MNMGTSGFEGIVPKWIFILSRIHDYATDYLYYRTPSPWLQIKLLKILTLFSPPEDADSLNAINDVLIGLVKGIEVGSKLDYKVEVDILNKFNMAYNNMKNRFRQSEAITLQLFCFR